MTPRRPGAGRRAGKNGGPPARKAKAQLHAAAKPGRSTASAAGARGAGARGERPELILRRPRPDHHHPRWTPAPAPMRGRSAGRRPTSPKLIFAGVAAGIVAAALAVAHHHDLPRLPALLASMNLAAFLLYGYDKAVAGRGRLRVPEAVLHGLALFGGTLGALLGQRLFRHKISKAAFQRVFLGTAVLQVALVIAWLCWSALG